MPTIRRSTRSKNDIVEIVAYVQRDNPDAAKKLLDAIEETLELLADFPLMGSRRDRFGHRLRSLPVKRYRRYVVFYRPTKHGIELARVLHGPRDLNRAFRRR